MTKYKIKYNREGCIGAFTCVQQAPQLFSEGEDGKADLIGGPEELIIEEKDIKSALEAAEVCPVRVIEVYNEETEEKLI